MAAHMEKGLILYDQHRYKDAEQEFRKALAESPQDARAHAMLAASLDAQKKHTDAIREAKEAIKLDPEFAYAYYVLFRPYVKSNRLKDAKAAIEQSLKLDPENPLYYEAAATIADVESDWPAMLKLAEQGLANEPEDIDCINARAKALTHLGRTEEAATSLEFALKIDPENSETHSNMGWVLVRRGRVHEAIDHFREALRLEPNSSWAYDGAVEALKARNPIYHRMLLVGLFFSSLSNKMRTWLYWIFWIVPPTRAIMIVFFLVSFCALTLFDFLLRLDPLGRRLLTPEAKVQNNYSLVGVALIVALAGYGWYYVSSDSQYRTLDEAKSLARRGQLERARKKWEKVIDKADSLAAAENYKEAQRILERLDHDIESLGKRAGDSRVDSFRALGDLYLRKQSYAEAIRYFDRAWQLAVASSKPLVKAKVAADLALSLSLDGQYVRAIPMFEEALTILKETASQTDDLERITKDYAFALKKGGQSQQAETVLSNLHASRTPEQYVRHVQSSIKDQWHPPKAGQDVDVTATFEIDAQGRLSHVKLVKSSDIATANDAARSAIYAAAPFDPLPDTLKPVAQIEFTFDYNVFKNRQPASR